MQGLKYYIQGMVFLDNSVSLHCLGSICTWLFPQGGKIAIAALALISLRFESYFWQFGQNLPVPIPENTSVTGE